jgi:hypothetical protein
MTGSVYNLARARFEQPPLVQVDHARAAKLYCRYCAERRARASARDDAWTKRMEANDA